MSCNGCRVLRKGCSETCILRPCLEWIQSPQAQANATLFVAKFFGRSGLMSFISSVPHKQGPALFQSLLFEACGRMVNPVNGAVGLLWTGHWHVCQAAVETVLRGGTLQEVSESLVKTNVNLNDRYENKYMNHQPYQLNLPQDFNSIQERDNEPSKDPMSNLGLSLKTFRDEKFCRGTSSMISEESETINCIGIVGSCDPSGQRGEKIKLLHLFT